MHSSQAARYRRDIREAASHAMQQLAAVVPAASTDSAGIWDALGRDSSLHAMPLPPRSSTPMAVFMCCSYGLQANEKISSTRLACLCLHVSEESCSLMSRPVLLLRTTCIFRPDLGDSVSRLSRETLKRNSTTPPWAMRDS